MEPKKPFKILFLCTGNSARSVLGEYLIRQVAQERFESYSAGSIPKGQVHPMTLRVLKEVHGIDASDARSKSVDEVKGIDFDFVITVCDSARDLCPVWPGQTIMAHWRSEDPAAASGSDEEVFRVFKDISFEIRRRIELFASLPLEKLEHLRLAEVTRQVGES